MGLDVPGIDTKFQLDESFGKGDGHIHKNGQEPIECEDLLVYCHINQKL